MEEKQLLKIHYDLIYTHAHTSSVVTISYMTEKAAKRPMQ